MTREIAVLTPEHVELKFELAGIGSRFIAMFVDTVLQGLAIGALALVFLLTYPTMVNVRGLSTWWIAFAIILFFVIYNGYFLFFEGLYNGQTPGKKAASIRVIRDTGHPADFRAVLLRNILRTVDSLPGMYGVGLVTMFLSPQSRRLGDYVAGTLVVKTRQKKKPDEPVVLQTAEANAQDQPDETAALLPAKAMPFLSLVTPDDYRTVRHFLDRRGELHEMVAMSLAVKMATPLAAKLRLDPEDWENPVRFLENLRTEWERRMIH